MEPEIISHSDEKKTRVGIIILVILGFLMTFVTGFFLSSLLSTEQGKTVSTQPSPTAQITKAAEVEQLSTKFAPGKHYFDDTVLLISKDEPHTTLVATVTRNEGETTYTQATRISYFDGANWTRKVISQTIPNEAIVSNEIVKQWEITIDPSRALKEVDKGEIMIGNTTFVFTSKTLTNEIAMRSLPGYTKFMSNGEATLQINGQNHDAYLLYTRIYSMNSSEIQFYDTPFGLTTDWIAFWDEAGNFYHVDKTSVDKPTKIYASHQIGVVETPLGNVTKTFSVQISRDTDVPPSNYTVQYQNNSTAQLQLHKLNSINKAPGNSYQWFMSQVEGTATLEGQPHKGIGVLEYIHN